MSYIDEMIAPSQRRPQVHLGGVLQIWTTRVCDKSCHNCTQASQLKGAPIFISTSQFAKACSTLREYFGVVGVFGGNPAVHPEFTTLCEIMRGCIPYERRGLWCNNPISKVKADAMRETFNPAVSNLNVHLDKTAYDKFVEWWPESKPFGLLKDSRHSPPYVAMKDVITDRSDREKLIAQCDINKNWSAMIGVFRGELRGYFCEIAGAQAMLHQSNPEYPDTGVEVVDDWWRMPITSYSTQIEKHCHECGIPLRGHGELSQDVHGVEQVSKTHLPIFQPKRKNQQVQVVSEIEKLNYESHVVTQYMQNGE